MQKIPLGWIVGCNNNKLFLFKAKVILDLFSKIQPQSLTSSLMKVESLNCYCFVVGDSFKLSPSIDHLVSHGIGQTKTVFASILIV